MKWPTYYRVSRTWGKGRYIIKERKESYKDKRCKKICILFFFVFCYIFWQFSNETESNVLIASDLPTLPLPNLPPFAIKKKEL
jgi:hypothetical protein